MHIIRTAQNHTKHKAQVPQENLLAQRKGFTAMTEGGFELPPLTVTSD